MSWKTFVGSVGEMALLVGEIGVGEVALTQIKHLYLCTFTNTVSMY